MRFKLIFWTLFLMSLSVQADTQTEMLMGKIDRLEREIAILQQSKNSVSNAPIQLPKNIDEFYNSLENQNQLIQNLTAQNEELSHEIAELKNKINQINDDVNFRFQELKKTPSVVSNEKKTTGSDNESSDYNQAYLFLKNGEYAKAEQAFMTFMEKYPKGKLIGNANYWLGETYYAQKQWPQAAGFFADGFSKYKDNNKSLDSLFKLGLTMKQMQKKQEACTAFQGVLENLKGNNKTLKDRSEKELKELKCPSV